MMKMYISTLLIYAFITMFYIGSFPNANAEYTSFNELNKFATNNADVWSSAIKNITNLQSLNGESDATAEFKVTYALMFSMIMKLVHKYEYEIMKLQIGVKAICIYYVVTMFIMYVIYYKYDIMFEITQIKNYFKRLFGKYNETTSNEYELMNVSEINENDDEVEDEETDEKTE